MAKFLMCLGLAAAIPCAADLPRPTRVFDLSGERAYGISAVAFRPDGKVFASDPGAGFHLWDTATGKLLCKVRDPDWKMGVCRSQGLKFSPDGKILALGVSHYGDDGDIFLWDVSDVTAPRQLRVLKGHTKAVWAVAFTPDGKTLISGGIDMQIKFWDVATGKETRTIKDHKQRILSLVLSGDGKLMVSADAGEVKLWDMATVREIASWRPKEPIQVALSPDKTRVAVACVGHTEIRDVATGEVVANANALAGCSVPIVFSPCGRVLATTFADRRNECAIRFVDPVTGCEVVRYRRGGGHFHCFAFSPDGRRLAAATYENLSPSIFELLDVSDLTRPGR